MQNLKHLLPVLAICIAESYKKEQKHPIPPIYRP